ncbi:glycosyltransferase family 39 protein [Thermodesulfobacterium sp. TA1]|uniref:ArnT family glycosyltransferase n=1 Tax=Thermodesulfobacterium sp. TA1 TaxID=2234087 RepID=UPI00143DD61E|nr:glycosyltransferase family 39 protein [Thermodesulfobacterium sp. TA1]
MFKLFYLFSLNLPLSYDESYYWDWSRHLDWGYYSKPPMVAWLIGLFTSLLGVSEWIVRLPALSSISLSTLFFYLILKKRLPSENKLFLALACLSLIPILTVYSFIITIDPPLLLFWTASLYFFLNYLEKSNLKHAFLTGLFMGLGVLTKQTMLSFVLIAFFYLLVFKRDFLKNPFTYLMFGLPFLMFLPNLYWNYINGFVMVRHTEEHFSRTGIDFLKGIKLIIEVLLLYTPLAWAFIWFSLKNLKRELFKTKDFIYFLGLPSLAFLGLSFVVEINANWILPFVVSGLLWVVYNLSFSKANIFLRLNLIYGAVFLVLACLFGAFPERFPDFTREILKKFLGWRELASYVETFYDGKTPIVVSYRDIASSLAFYLKSHPEVYVVQKKTYPENQYHLWRKEVDLIGKEIIYIQKNPNPPKKLKNPVKIGEVRVKISEKSYKEFYIWKGIWDKEV